MPGYQNFFATTLYTDIGASDTAITLETIPVETSGRLVLEARNPTQREVISYSGIAGNQVTGVVRGIGGTTAKSHTKNSLVEMNLTAEDIEDLYDAFASFAATNGSGWYTLATPNITSVVYNGNRSYTMTLLGDRTNLLNPGTRLRTTRTTAAPTQSTSLNGTTQYWVKTSPNKLTFTDDFVVSAWIKLNSYPAAGAMIASRYNGTSGWSYYLDSSGRLNLQGVNAGSGNYSLVQSYQSIPLNKWVHVTAQLDMSAFTATSTTSYTMIDGVDVPALVFRAGTNPTALVQAGNLEIGSANGGASPFPGKIAQVAIYNAKVTQATILASISQGLTGTETSLASAYSFNGVATDLNTTTPNDLTAQNSAGYTADSPFGTQASGLISSTVDYGIVQAATFSTNTTLTVQVPEGCTIPTSGGVSAVSYSGVKAPYGFPAQLEKWRVVLTSIVSTQFPVSALGTWLHSMPYELVVPIGNWNIGALVNNEVNGTISAAITYRIALGTSTTTADLDLCSGTYGANVSVMYFLNHTNMRTPKTLTSATRYYLNNYVEQAGGTVRIVAQGARSATTIYAENGYL